MAAKRVLIIGAVALGPKVACRLKRLRPDFQVTMLDQGEYISYGGCGIPYYISGDLSDIKELLSTSFHMLRTPEFFEDAKDVRVRTRTRALAIDRQYQQVLVKDLESGREEGLPYDYLVLATGSRPRRLPVPGVDLPGVMHVASLPAAMAVREMVTKGEVGRAVIIGAGAIGCEMAEALSDLWGVETSLVELAPQVLPGLLDPGLARMVQKHLRDKEIDLYLEEQVREIRQVQGGEHPLEVVTASRTLAADLVITAVGAAPNSQLAQDAGLLVSPHGGILVNRRLQTTDPLIYAGGDCIDNHHLITGRPVYFPSGSLANRQGRVIGTNLAGGAATFNGIVGSFTLKIFDLAIAGTGLSLTAARREGFDAVDGPGDPGRPGPLLPHPGPHVPATGGGPKDPAPPGGPGPQPQRRRPGGPHQQHRRAAALQARSFRSLQPGGGLRPALRRGPGHRQRRSQHRREHPGWLE